MRTLVKLIIYIGLLSLIGCDYKSNTSYFQLKNHSDKLQLNFLKGYIQLYNYGHTGKSIFKIVKYIESNQQYNEFAKTLENLKNDFRCTLSESSLVCLIYGNEFNELKNRKIDVVNGTGTYEISFTLPGGNTLTMTFEINKDLILFDLQLKAILG